MIGERNIDVKDTYACSVVGDYTVDFLSGSKFHLEPAPDPRIENELRDHDRKRQLFFAHQMVRCGKVRRQFSTVNPPPNMIDLAF